MRVGRHHLRGHRAVIPDGLERGHDAAPRHVALEQVDEALDRADTALEVLEVNRSDPRSQDSDPLVREPGQHHIPHIELSDAMPLYRIILSRQIISSRLSTADS